jgi:hypothetical protein
VSSLLQATGFNAFLMMSTSAVVYRLVQEFRPTLLLDEMEGLAGDDARSLLACRSSSRAAPIGT